MINPSELGNTIRTKRIERNMTQLDLAKLCECTSNYINLVERGKTSITIDKANWILQRLGYTIDVKLSINQI